MIQNCWFYIVEFDISPCNIWKGDEHFVTQEQTDVHFSGFTNTLFLLSLLLLSRFTGYFCNMQNIRCIRGGTYDLGLYCNVPTRLEGHFRSKWGFRLQSLHLNTLLLSGGFLSHVPPNFWRSLVRAEHLSWWGLLCGSGLCNHVLNIFSKLSCALCG